MDVYVDILFLENFIIDFLIIRTCARVMSSGISLLRSITASALGGFFGVLIFLPDFSFISTLVTAFSEALLISVVAFYPDKVKELFKRCVLMFTISVLVAGAGFGDMVFFSGGAIKNGIFYTSFVRIVTVAFLVCTGVSISCTHLRKRASRKISGVILELNGRKAKVQGLVDTGNGLSEPVTGKPVMLIDEKTLKKLAGEGCNASNLPEWVESERIKRIPYHTIDGGGELKGIMLDRAYIDGRRIDGAVAAVCEKSLSYPVILHTGM